MGYFYRGRHRVPSNHLRTTGRIAATGAAAVVLPLAFTGQAHAAVPDVNWDPIIACESGGDPAAANTGSTASGLYQFLDSTWKSLGGSTARAKDASVAEQTAIANKAYAQSGLAPWAASQSCWAGKSAPAPVKVHKATPKATHTAHHSASVPKPAVTPKATKSRLPAAPHGNYTVRSGDTLSGLAGVHWRDVYNANRATIGSNPDRIYPGQQLTL
jgi:nucleoid-associated protein YgaU